MDTSGFCQVGRFGTLSLLKQQCGSIDDNVVASFGIDDDELTFGSSTTCGVRLYYPDVDGLHCKIVFDQYKAFLAILGLSGAVVDGCKVFPHTSGESPSSTQQTIIPLSNNSVFEIHGKRFRFTYPPKELRKALYATPARPPKRTLRLSMIHSAQVFSPRPSNDPQENLKILQSPMKNPSRSPLKQANPSPLKSYIVPDSELEEPIVLVHTNHPRVVEEEKDLVILEDIPVELLSPSKSGALAPQQFPVIRTQNPPQTPPRRKSLGGTALHRAVLIRSAQRAVMKAEEEEEMEVLDTVVDEDEAEDLNQGNDHESGDVEIRDMEDEEETDEGQVSRKYIWTTTLEKLMPWSSSSSSAETEAQDDKSMENIDKDEVPERLARPWATFTPSKKMFMTPQYRGSRNKILQNFDAPVESSVGPGRLSLGGGEAKRVVIQQPWKVRDLVLPPAAPFTESRPLMPIDPPAGTHPSPNPQIATPMKPTSGTPNYVRPLISVSEEERKAIQERRRSAVKELGDNSFWAGGAPGMSPAKGIIASSNSPVSHSPKKSFGSAFSSVIRRPESRSPTKGRLLTYAITEGDENKNDKSVEDEDLDTHGLLEKMKETVNDMKRRRSVVLSSSTGLISTPQRVTMTPTASTASENDVKKFDLTKMGTPDKLSLRAPTPKSLSYANTFSGGESVEVAHEESFSLFRPGAVNVMNNTLQAQESGTADPGVEEELSVEPTTYVQPGFWSATRPREEAPGIETEHDVDNETEATAPKSTEKAILPRRQRSRTPLPSFATEEKEAGTSVPTRRGRRLGLGLVTEHEQEQCKVEKLPMKRSRKPYETVTAAAVEKEESPPPVIAKRGRARNKAAPSVDAPKTRAKPPSREPASKVRSGSKAKPLEEDIDDEDPLDSYYITSVLHEEDGEAESAPPVAAVVMAKGKPKTTSNRRKPSRIKQEKEDPEGLPPPVPTRAKRSTRGNGASQPVVTPAVKATTSKTRGRPKTPATAPAILEVDPDPEKENAGQHTGVTLMEKSLEPEIEDASIKLRVSRSRTATGRKAAKVDDDDEQHLVPGRQRATRVMRTRTKTG